MCVGHRLLNRMDLGCEDFRTISETELAFRNDLTVSHSIERTTYGVLLLLVTIRVIGARRPRSKAPSAVDTTEVMSER